MEAFSLGNCCEMKDENAKARRKPVERTVSFIRAHDLDLTAEEVAKCLAEEEGEDEQRSDVACRTVSSSSSTGTAEGVGKKEILSLSGGSGSGAIMSALVAIGLNEASDESDKWSATSGTEKLVKARAKRLKKGKSPKANDGGDVAGPWPNAPSGRDVYVWSAKCDRPGHGADYPVVKSRGLIPASASEVADLVRDSGRVMEYNKMSIGREDQAILTREDDSSVHCPDRRCPRLGVAGEAKIMSSKSHPPLTRKPLEFKTLFYARRVGPDDGVATDGPAYVTVGRSVWETAEGTTRGSDGSTTRCEILLSVNLVREIETEDGERWCELTCVTHAISPGIPMFLAKQVAFVAAENYVKDIRALFEK